MHARPTMLQHVLGAELDTQFRSIQRLTIWCGSRSLSLALLQPHKTVSWLPQL